MKEILPTRGIFIYCKGFYDALFYVHMNKKGPEGPSLSADSNDDEQDQ